MNIAEGNLIVKMLEKRCGQLTLVHLENGELLNVNDIAWGYDMGDDFAHITTNISPPQEGVEVNFFYVNEVSKLLDPGTGKTIHEPESQ
ncbi:hypothetical protein GNX18_12670 [Microbulbifer sp. SH-1]|uniref:hypothetical protein n=1 Tax=Microbulbifer sp. SH-1 TaxID=2681547 RepID=UPI00140B7003|nr:hypothetical protein [Microbulbifer sp. SH-1]QIL90515.1 hypothetical protein GNX18_12670 [Microbulbifer sp. SH-1]